MVGGAVGGGALVLVGSVATDAGDVVVVVDVVVMAVLLAVLAIRAAGWVEPEHAPTRTHPSASATRRANIGRRRTPGSVARAPSVLHESNASSATRRGASSCRTAEMRA